MEIKQVILVCSNCKKETEHLVGYSSEWSSITKLQYIQGRSRCLSCNFERPTLEELDQYRHKR